MMKKIKAKLQRPLAYIAVSALLANSIFWTTPAMALGGFELSSSIVSNPINEYRVDIAPGVKEKRYTFEDKYGRMTGVFVAEVDIDNSSVSIKAGTPDGGNTIGLQTVIGQAESVSFDNHRVVAAVNGDYFNMATGEPFGIVYKDGEVVKPGQYSTWKFFGITKDGQAVIGDAAYFDSIKDNIKEGLGGQTILVKDGNPFEQPMFNPGRNPRTAVGIKYDGDIFFVTVDGRQESYSSGIEVNDFAQLMIDLGAETALDLDGGGSTTYVSRQPGEDTLQLVNRPSGGAERKVANSWLIVSTAKSDHIFDSAFIEPYNQSFTPNSTIYFNAKGRDSALASALLPNYGLRWELSNSKYGRIYSDGKFVSNGVKGEVEVILRHNGKIVGKTLIGLGHPDELKFGSPQLTVLPNSSKPLNLVALTNKNVLTLKPEDIEWQVPNTLGTVDDKGVLHVLSNPTAGKITATYEKTGLKAELDVNIGRLPETLFEFDYGLGSWTSTVVGRGEKASVGLSSSPSEPVLFGSKALKINFDFTSGQKETTLGVYAGPVSGNQIPGSPTTIGMFVYATLEAKGYWLRSAITDDKGNIYYLNLTPSVPGIDWTGWKYVEAKIPSGITGPLYFHPYQAIRLMSSNSGVSAPLTKGSLYIDNIRAVYGEDIDDIEDYFAK